MGLKGMIMQHQETCYGNSHIKMKTTVLKSGLWNYSGDVYILVKRDITNIEAGKDATARQGCQ